ncbi:MAG: response regulator [Verrucomicrobia bacterium]|nr:response regulator [Verrucomicrobiota bacterium]
MRKILIIEDDPEVREMLVSSLQPHGFELIEAANGRAGVQLAQVYMPDLILSDIKMEGFDGYAALAAVRYQPLTSTIPFVLMTGHPDEQGRRFAMELGADDYLAKPFTISALLATIRIQLKKQEAIKERALKPAVTRQESIDETPPPQSTPAPAPVHGALLVSDVATPREAARVVADAIPVEAVSRTTAAAGLSPVSMPVNNVETLVETYLRMLNRFHPNLGNTAMRAVALCRTMGETLKLSAADSQDLCWAAALHDISLVGIDREAVGRWLRNPRKVTEEEDAFIKRHPIESQEMLSDVAIFQTAGCIIRAHHENWDGTGYPDGLKGDAIPAPARLLVAAISYCSLHTLGIPALKQLKAHSGTVFDPAAVEAVAEAAVVAKMPKGVREILLNEMKPGQIVAKEIYNSTGMVLIRKGRELTDTLINRVMAINRVAPLDQNVLVRC